jgi:hypothetical protein
LVHVRDGVVIGILGLFFLHSPKNPSAGRSTTVASSAASREPVSTPNSMAGTVIPPNAAAPEEGAADVAQIARHELPLELQTRDEEEDREQAVGSPLREGQVEVQPRRAEPDLTERGAGIPHGEFAQASADGRHDEQQPAYGLRPKNLGDPACLGPGAAVEEATGGTRTPSSHFGAIVLSATLRNSTTVPRCDLR